VNWQATVAVQVGGSNAAVGAWFGALPTVTWCWTGELCALSLSVTVNVTVKGPLLA
jgi:hypothetical protein